MNHSTPLFALFVWALLTLGCGPSEEVEDGGNGGSCGADTACTADAPSVCGTVCQDICGGFDNFDTAGCGDDNRCFCVCIPGTGVCEPSE